MKILFEALVQHCNNIIRNQSAGLDERAALRLLEVHLEPAHFAMPIHDVAVEKRLIAWSQGKESMAAATPFLLFEETRSIRGIARVLARSHINRQGVANVTRGAQWKVQSPRVVGVFDLAPDDAALHRWTQYRPLLEAFQELAHRNCTVSADVDIHFAPEDIQKLDALAKLTPQQAREMGAQDVPGGGKPGWARVVLGLYTGLCYLDERFGFDPARVWASLEAAQTVTQVDALAKDAQRHITEFGARLAPSFFADLGCTGFVKADVHVSDVIRAVLKTDSELAPQLCIDFVRQMAEETGRTPRAIDKLMYLACSGKFYLAGVSPSKAAARANKQKLLAELSRRDTKVSRPADPSNPGLSLGNLS